METQNPRIIGYDIARGLAILGMVFVNFKTVMSPETTDPLYLALNLLSGKAAALFVVLAGVGMTLMYQSAERKKDPAKIKKVKISLLKRALFLFVVGLSYYVIWPADILHYYGVYMVIGVLLLGASTRWLVWISTLLVLGYMGLLLVLDYEAGWDWTLLEYTDFFTIKGFVRNMFFNGFHPVVPWVAFLLTGIWIGRINFHDRRVHRRVAITALIFYVVFQGISSVLVGMADSLPAAEAEVMRLFLATEPMPPNLFYMVSASSMAVVIITLSIAIGQRFADTLIVRHLVSTGQLALTNYFFHVVIGMLGVYLVMGEVEQAFSIRFSFFYALFFNIITVIFSHLWRQKYDRGPLEMLMRKVTG